MAEFAHWALDVPLRIIAIVLGALVVSWLLRRAVGKVLRRLHSGAMEERVGAVRAASPAPSRRPKKPACAPNSGSRR